MRGDCCADRVSSVKLKSKRSVWKLSTSRYKYQVFLALGQDNHSLRGRRPMEDKRTMYFLLSLMLRSKREEAISGREGGV